MKSVLKAVGGVMFCLLAGALLAIATLAWRPEWFLTPPRLSKVVEAFGASYQPRWKALELRVDSPSLASKVLRVHAVDFCFNGSSGTLRGCFNRVDAELALTFSPRGVYLTRIARMDVDGRFLALDLAHAAPSPKKQKLAGDGRYQSLPELLPNWLGRLRIDGMDVRLPNNTIVLQSTASLAGDVSLTYSTGQARPLEIAGRLVRIAEAKRENINARLSIGSDLFTRGALTYIEALGRLDGDLDNNASLETRIEQKSGGETGFFARADARDGARRLTARVSGRRTLRGHQARLSARLSDPAGPVRALSINACDAETFFKSGSRSDALSIACRLSVEPAPFGAPPGAEARKIDVTIDLDGRLKPRGIQRDFFEATLRAAVVPRKDWYDFNASFKAELTGRLGGLPRSLRSKHRLDAALKVERFEDLVAYLRATAYAVPAPLHVLRGPLEFTLNSAGDTRSPDQEIIYRLRSDLAAGRQKLKAAVEGKLLAKRAFTPNRRLKDRAKVVIEDVALELPYLTVGGLPPVTVDPRITTSDPKVDARQARSARAVNVKKATAPGIDHASTIVTRKPIMLYSNINPAPIPVALDLLARPAGLSGSIVVQRFDAELFRKKGVVDHVRFSPSPGSRAMALDGLVRFRQDEADILVKLLGSTEKPRVVFESEPPLDPQAIIALLLFNKAPDDLDPDQSASVSNSQSALANGAFGLASLYLFASTPIQRVGYDPATQTYAIKFSLPGGASLEVGSGADQSRHLTLRKRLARRWVLQTEVRRNQDDERSAVTTFLEWFQRY